MRNNWSFTSGFSSFSAITVTDYLIISCAGQSDSSDNSITLRNPLNIDKVDEPVVITRNQLIELIGTIPDELLPVVQDEQDNLFASEVDDVDLNGEWDELSLLANIPADTSLYLTIQYRSEGDHPNFMPRTNIRFGVKQDSVVEHVEELEIIAEELPTPPYARFQMDGPVWENDKVGFRQYIVGRNAKDLYGKRNSEMALDFVGLSDQDGTL